MNSYWYIDELIYVKLSRFLASGHLASSSSYYSIYLAHNATLPWGTEVQIVQPWLDHPPLFSILAIPFWLAGLPRLLPVLLGSGSTLMVVYLMRKRRYEALLSGLVFSLFPFAASMNAMMFLDNGSSFFFLLTMSLTSRYEEDKSNVFLILAGISAGLSFLSKEFGVYSIIYLFFYLLLARRLFKGSRALLAAVGIASIYFVGGFLLNSGLFIDILNAQAIVTSGVRTYPGQSLWNTALRDFSFDQNGFVLGDISLLLLASWVSLGVFLGGSKNRIVKLGIFSFLLTIIAVRYFWFYSWIAIYPFFSLALAHVICESFLPVSKYIQSRVLHAEPMKTGT